MPFRILSDYFYINPFIYSQTRYIPSMDSDDTIHKQSFSIDDLATRSVTIYPTRAAVVRDIENVVIKVSQLAATRAYEPN